MRFPFVFMVFAASAVLACSGTEPAPSSPAASTDAGATAPSGDAGAGEQDAAEAGGAIPSPTKKTDLEATINAVTRTLDRAQYGTTTEGASETLYLEAHEGGVAECPEKETPKRTLIVSGVPKGAPGDTFTTGDGVGVSLFDFAGDQVTTAKPFTTAKAAKVTIVALEDGASAEIEVEATFDEGTVKGRLYATYCAAMSE